MKVDRDERFLPEKPKETRPWGVILIVAATVAAIVVVASPGSRELILDKLRGAGVAVGLTSPPQQEYADTLQRLGISDLSESVAVTDKVSANLAKLTKEKCDKTAIFGLSQALLAAREPRAAAYADFGFAATCPDSENEEYAAATILLNLGNSNKTIAICDELVKQNPGNGIYRYMRGKALVAVKRYQEALPDYRATIELAKNPRLLTEAVFTEMANVFVALGQQCDAAKTILAWVALDPATRNTMAAHKTIQEYAGRDCLPAAAPGDVGKL